jgi:hypothetical protein
VEKITCRNWNECYRISNDSVTIIINASAGGRIMVYERGGTNVIYENPEQDGLLLEDYLREGFDPDGGRFDYGQEEITRNIHAGTYMGPWTGKIINESSLRITSIADKDLGILSTRIFTLDPHSSQLSIIQTMKNISDKPAEYFFWGRTLIKVGGKLFMPLNPESRYPDKWGRYIWEEPEKFESDTGDPGVSIKDNIFSLIPEKARNAKYGNDSHAGWMAYGYKSLLFIKKYGYFPEAIYSERYGQTNIFYTDKYAFAEMEPISPAAFLKPGEEFSYSEDWYLLDYPPCSETGFDVTDSTEFILGKIYGTSE